MLWTVPWVLESPFPSMMVQTQCARPKLGSVLLPGFNANGIPMSRGGAARKTENDAPFVPFLTAFDPTDLPGGSVDPLGFDRGYNFLGDKLLPGLTNVGSQPRYFGLLCAGSRLAAQAGSPRADAEARERCVLRLERLWALANVLASDGENRSAAGVRGVTYAEAQREALSRSGRTKTTAGFALLARQVQYGVLGIYGNVAHGMRLLDRRSLALTPDFGEAIGEAFLDETGSPQSVRRAALDDDAEVGVEALRSWGDRAHIASRPGIREAGVLRQAIHGNAVRSRMLRALAATSAEENETELKRLQRIARELSDDDTDLREAMAVIAAFESCYQHAVLVLERALWSCGASGSYALVDLAADEVMQACSEGFRAAASRISNAIEKAATPEFRRDLERLDDVRHFVSRAADTNTAGAFVEEVLLHHGDVQRGKFDRGRRKLPWVEIREGRAVLTLARAGQIEGEPRDSSDVTAHAYRTGSAEALLIAAEEA
jgi:hypothetical protein